MKKILLKIYYAIKNKVREPSTPQIPTVPPLEAPPTPISSLPDYERSFPNLQTNAEGLKLCMESEGYHKKLPNGDCKAYLCPANVWTIGWGTTVYSDGTKVKSGDILTEKQALEEFKYEMDVKEDKILNYFTKNNLKFTSNEFSALMSFAYNLGEGVVLSKNYEMGRAILSGDRTRIAKAFMLYTKAKNKWGIKTKLRGLVIRRTKERNLFLKKEVTA